MKRLNSELFNELRRTSSYIVAAWKVTRTDGVVMGFTSGDQPFTYGGVEYLPTNSFSASAHVSKNNFSVDNMNAIALTGDHITEKDLMGGVYDNAKVELFWIRPDKPEWGHIPIRGGRIGEVKINKGQFETELRALTQLLQQDFGDFYTLECSATLGDHRCKVRMDPPVWAPEMSCTAEVVSDAALGTVVRPSTPNGFWYYCVNGANTVSTDVPANNPYFQSAHFKALEELSKFFGPITEMFRVVWSRAHSGTGNAMVAQPAVRTLRYGKTGNTEPAWPTTEGATVVDGEVTWQARLAREATGTVTGVYNRAVFDCRDFNTAYPNNYFQYGYLQWETGENAGFKMEIREYTRNPRPGFKLMEAMPYPIKPGDTFRAWQGCPKTRYACKEIFRNIDNMRAFPDMPTEDKALSTPNYSQQGTAVENRRGGKGR